MEDGWMYANFIFPNRAITPGDAAAPPETHIPTKPFTPPRHLLKMLGG
jgi:hypothetical protein